MNHSFLDLWAQSARTSLGLFWMAFWAFAFGYLISSSIQVFVTRKRMQESMGEAGPKSVFLGTVFGFLSSSCSFSALSGTRALFAKGAGLVPSLAFLLASTNLVIELGMVIAVFLSWQFVVGEYAGGILLILITWLVVKISLPNKLEETARQHARKKESSEDKDGTDWKQLIQSREGWFKVARQYAMEWDMVWKDVTIGFTVAGVISAFVPREFFQALFIGSGGQTSALWEVLLQALVGPLAAFFTFIGSMGNIPLAAVLLDNGVSFAGVMAFIFSDLVVFPVLRIQAQYYGWKMALYILAVFLVALVTTAVILHYGFAGLDLLPEGGGTHSVTGRDFFRIDYTFFLNLFFIIVSLSLYLWKRLKGKSHNMGSTDLSEKILFYVAMLALTWLAGGLTLSILS